MGPSKNSSGIPPIFKGPSIILIEGRTVPDHSIAAGVPAKVIGPMTQKHYDLVKMNAEEYVELGKQYKAEGTLEHDAAP